MIRARPCFCQPRLAEASDIGDFLASAAVAAGRMKIRTASFCTERSGHFDSFDQGLILSVHTPDMTRLPCASVTAFNRIAKCVLRLFAASYPTKRGCNPPHTHTP